MRIKKEIVRRQERQRMFLQFVELQKNTGDLCARCRKK